VSPNQRVEVIEFRNTKTPGSSCGGQILRARSQPLLSWTSIRPGQTTPSLARPAFAISSMVSRKATILVEPAVSFGTPFRLPRATAANKLVWPFRAQPI
jgi:hypothetical protein